MEVEQSLALPPPTTAARHIQQHNKRPSRARAAHTHHDQRHEEAQLHVLLQDVLKLLDDERRQEQTDAKRDEPAGAAARNVDDRLAAFFRTRLQ
jgi:tRNA(Ile)-lysidine synthase TilS/MesJ